MFFLHEEDKVSNIEDKVAVVTREKVVHSSFKPAITLYHILKFISNLVK